jgi:hypothetical protein
MRHPVRADRHPGCGQCPDALGVDEARPAKAASDREERGGHAPVDGGGKHNFDIGCVTVVKRKDNVRMLHNVVKNS